MALINDNKQFRLAQTTTEIQELFNLLITNFETEGRMLVANGSQGIKFVNPVASGDNYIKVNNNIVTLDIAKLQAAILVGFPDMSTVENTSNKASLISAANKTSTTEYPSIKAVVDYLANFAFTTSNITSVAAIKENFIKKQLTSGTLYLSYVEEDGRPYPCIFAQAGNIQTVGAAVSLMILYRNKRCIVQGVVAAASVTVASSDDLVYDLSQMATISYVNNLITGTLNGEY